MTGEPRLTRVEFCEGDTVRATRFVNLNDPPSVWDFSFTQAETDSITQWDNLWIRFRGYVPDPNALHVMLTAPPPLAPRDGHA